MAYNFVCGDRDQPFLLPPDLRDWLPDGHLAWCVLDATDQLDLTPFYRAHRDDGHGRPAYDPRLLLGVLLYTPTASGSAPPARSNAAAWRTSRFGSSGRQPHPRPRHHRPVPGPPRAGPLADFLVASLRLCAEAGMVQVGMVQVGVVALDGTKLAGHQ